MWKGKECNGLKLNSWAQKHCVAHFMFVEHLSPTLVIVSDSPLENNQIDRTKPQKIENLTKPKYFDYPKYDYILKNIGYL